MPDLSSESVGECSIMILCVHENTFVHENWMIERTVWALKFFNDDGGSDNAGDNDDERTSDKLKCKATKYTIFGYENS